MHSYPMAVGCGGRRRSRGRRSRGPDDPGRGHTRVIRQQLPAPLGGSRGHFASRGGSILRRDVIARNHPCLRVRCPPTTPWVSFIGTRRARGRGRHAGRSTVRAAQSTQIWRARVPLTTETESCVHLDCSFAMGGWLVRHILHHALDTRRCTQGNCVVFFFPFWNVLLRDAVFAIIAIESKNIDILFEQKNINT